MIHLAEEGITMICVTQQLAFARQVANRIVFMDAGQIVEVNEPEAFFRHAPASAHARVPRSDPRWTVCAPL